MKDGMRVLIAYDGSGHADAALVDQGRSALGRLLCQSVLGGAPANNPLNVEL